MKIRHVLALGVLGCAGAICATGFPRRIGLTRSEAAVSLPGDLELPNADVVVDRSGKRLLGYSRSCPRKQP